MARAGPKTDACNPNDGDSMTPERTIENLRRIAGVCRLNDSEVGVVAGVSPCTARIVLKTGELPKLPRVRDRFVRFVAVNADACRRSDLRFVDD